MYVAGPDMMQSTLGHGPIETLIHFGLNIEWIELKVKNGFKFRFFVFPEQQTEVADWDGLYKIARKTYDKQTYAKLLPFKKELESTPLVQIPDYRSIVMETKILSAENIHLLPKKDMTLWHARSFFFHEFGANHLYLGNGVNYSGYLEYVMVN